MEARQVVITLLLFVFMNNGCRTVEDVWKDTKNASSILSGSEMKPFENQVAGHLGFMKDSEGFLLKDARYPKEIDFFDSLQNTSDPELQEFKTLIPAYGGSVILGGVTYMRIEDLTEGVVSPCVIDIKMGKQIWEPDMPAYKIALVKSRYPEMRETFEFCIQGIKYFDIVAGKAVKHGIHYHEMKIEEGLEFLYNFVNGRLGVESGLVDRILEQLRKINSWFQRQTRYHFTSTSVLIVYDAKSLARDKSLNVRVRLIDFAHVYPSIAVADERDENFIGGLERLIAVFQNFLPETMSEEVLPDSLRPFDIQLTDLVSTGRRGCKFGMLRDSEGHLLSPNPGDNEIHFYETLNTTRDPILQELKQYVPLYFGIKNITVNEEVVSFLNLENTIKDFQLPCSMGVEIGFIHTPADTVSETDVIHQLRFVALKKKWSFGIPGFAYHNISDGTFAQEGTELGYRMGPREAVQSLYKFVNGEIGIECGVIDSILVELRKIRSWFERQRLFQFYSSSILLAYDAKNLKTAFSKRKESIDNGDVPMKSICEGLQIPVRVIMLNFDKIIPSQEDKMDENYLIGLQNLMSTLDHLSTLYADTL